MPLPSKKKNSKCCTFLFLFARFIFAVIFLFFHFNFAKVISLDRDIYKIYAQIDHISLLNKCEQRNLAF